MTQHNVVSVSLYALVTQRSPVLKIHLQNYERNILHLIVGLHELLNGTGA